MCALKELSVNDAAYIREAQGRSEKPSKKL